MENSSKNINILVILSSFIIAAYPCLFIYFSNVGEAYFKDILPISIIFFCITAIYILVLNFLVFKNIDKTAFFTNISLILLLNFKLVERMLTYVFSKLQYWHVLIIVTFILTNIFMSLLKSNHNDALQKVNLILLAVFSCLIVFNMIISAPAIFKNINSGVGQTALTPNTADSSWGGGYLRSLMFIILYLTSMAVF